MGRVQLHCPSTHKTIDGFVIGAYQKPEQVLQGVRLALDIKYAALYTTDARHISDPQTLQEDERVLVAAHEDEVMLPDAVYSYVLYAGEEEADVDPDVEGYGEEWVNLSDHEKSQHILSLSVTKPSSRNKMRITRPYAAVHAEMVAIKQCDISVASAAPLPSSVSVSVSAGEQEQEGEGKGKSEAEPSTSNTPHETLIQDRWGISLDALLPPSMKPSTGKYTSTTHASALAPATLAALSLFASCTHGQPRLACEVLSEAVALRTEEDQTEDRDPVLRMDDVLNALDMVYERAGVIPVKLTKGKSGKARKRAKGRARKSEGSGGA